MRLKGRELRIGEATIPATILSSFSTEVAKESGLVNGASQTSQINEVLEVGGVPKGQLTTNPDHTD